MAEYRKHEAQEWAWGFLKDQWTTIMTPFTPDNRIDEEGKVMVQIRERLARIEGPKEPAP